MEIAPVGRVGQTDVVEVLNGGVLDQFFFELLHGFGESRWLG